MDSSDPAYSVFGSFCASNNEASCFTNVSHVILLFHCQKQGRKRQATSQGCSLKFSDCRKHQMIELEIVNRNGT